jgi:hypothetical protein
VRGVGRAMYRSSQHLQGLDRHDPSGDSNAATELRLRGSVLRLHHQHPTDKQAGHEQAPPAPGAGELALHPLEMAMKL